MLCAGSNSSAGDLSVILNKCSFLSSLYSSGFLMIIWWHGSCSSLAPRHHLICLLAIFLILLLVADLSWSYTMLMPRPGCCCYCRGVWGGGGGLPCHPVQYWRSISFQKLMGANLGIPVQCHRVWPAHCGCQCKPPHFLDWYNAGKVLRQCHNCCLCAFCLSPRPVWTSQLPCFL